VPGRVSQCSQITAQSTRSSSTGPQQLAVAVQPLDSFGSVVRGLDDIIAEVRVCRALGPCTKDSALLPVVYEPFDPQTGVSSSSFQLECPRGMGADKVALEVALVRFAEVPVLRALIHCGHCRAGESRTEDSVSNTWFCVACADNEYVVDPNNAAHSCQACPTGGSCNGSAFTPLPGKCFSKSLYIVSLFSEYSRPLTFENLCQAQSGSETTLQVSTVL